MSLCLSTDCAVDARRRLEGALADDRPCLVVEGRIVII